jgi:hypothetical protein
MSKKQKLEALYQQARTLINEEVTAIPPMVWSKHGEDDDHDIVHVIEGLQKLEKVKRDLTKEEKVAIAKVVEIYEAEKLAEEQVKIVRKIQQERKEEECDAAVEKKLKDLEKAAVEKLFMHLEFLESKDVKGMVRQLLVTEGPMMQSQFLPKWKKLFPDYQFDFKTWGFERLTATLEALPDLVVITKDDPKNSFLSLKGGPPPPIGGAAADGAAPKGAGMSREVMTGVPEQGNTDGRKPLKHRFSSEEMGLVHTRAFLRSSEFPKVLVHEVHDIKLHLRSLDQTRAHRDNKIINRLGFLFVTYRVEFWCELPWGFPRSPLAP